MDIVCKNKKCINNKNNKCYAHQVEITYDGVCSIWEILNEIETLNAIERNKKDKILKEYLGL